MPQPAPRAVIFDMDGLMIDSERLYWKAGRAVAARYGKTVEPAVFHRLMGRKAPESMAIFREALGITAPVAVLLEEREALMRAYLRDDLVPMPGLFEFLERFRGRLACAIATGAERAYLDTTLDRLGIRGEFAVLVPSDGIARGKPDPEIYLRAVELLGVPAGACFVLEDAPLGVQAGARAGCRVIAVPSEYTAGLDFSAAEYVAAGLDGAAAYVEAALAKTPDSR